MRPSQQNGNYSNPKKQSYTTYAIIKHTPFL